MTDHKINPDLTIRGHACHYDTPRTVAEQLDSAETADYTNCSGARADLGDDE